jgi:hypothetical protein
MSEDGTFRSVLVNGVGREFAITDTIAQNNRRLDTLQAEGQPAALLPTRRLEHGKDTYPSTDTYQFQEFAGVVFELGGYGDITMIDPYTLRRLWVADALAYDEVGGGTYLLNAIRLACDVAEATGFFAGKE